MTREECYRVLELPLTASMEEVRKSYIRLSKKYHPDVNMAGKYSFQRINEAYNRIKDGNFTYGMPTSDVISWVHSFRQQDPRDQIRFLVQLSVFFLITVVPMLFVLKSLVTEIVIILVEVIKYSFYATKYITISILQLLTVMLMNTMDLFIYAVVIVYSITIRPIFFVSAGILTALAPAVQECKLLIVVCTAIVLVVKLCEYSHYRKVGALIASVLILTVVIISDFFI